MLLSITTESYLAPNVSSIAAEKSCLTPAYKSYLPKKTFNSTSFLLHSLLCPTALQCNDKLVAASVVYSVEVRDQC